MENPRFELFKSPKDDQFYFHLKAGNGEIILHSEGYTTKQNCILGITAVKTNAAIDSRYDRQDETGNYTFNLKSANREIIGRSQNYASMAARETGISAVKREAADACTEDTTREMQSARQ